MTLTLSLATLPAGKAEGDGKMHITLCDFIVPWDTLSTTQKKSLNHRYQMGCECKVSQICVLIPPPTLPSQGLQVDSWGQVPWLPRPSGRRVLILEQTLGR